MVLSTYKKQRILYYWRNGLRSSQILSALRVEGIISCQQTVSRFIRRFLARGTISRKEGSGRLSVITDRVLQLFERAMKSDNETTVTQLHVLLNLMWDPHQFLHYSPQLQYAWVDLSWVKVLPADRPRNQFKRLQWAVTSLPELLAGGFEDVIWTDETSVQLESHWRHSHWKKGQPAILKPRPKHPVKLHVWAGISKKGEPWLSYLTVSWMLLCTLKYCNTVWSTIPTQTHTGCCKIMTPSTPLQK